MPFNCQRYTDRSAEYVSWNGEKYVSLLVFQVSNVYTKCITLDEAVPGTWEGSFTHKVYGIGIYFDQETGQIFYASNRPVFQVDGCRYTLMDWTSHKLYDLAQKTNRERQALKDAFAELCSSKLSPDVLCHIFRFC